MATTRKYRTRFTQAVVTLSVSSTALGFNVPQLLAAPVGSPTVTAPMWARVTAPNGNNNDQVSAVRTPDGALHVVWVNPGPGATEDLHETVLSSSGRANSPRPSPKAGPPSPTRPSSGSPVVPWRWLRGRLDRPVLPTRSSIRPSGPRKMVAAAGRSPRLISLSAVEAPTP